MVTSEAQEIKKQETLVKFSIISYKTRLRVHCLGFVFFVNTLAQKMEFSCKPWPWRLSPLTAEVQKFGSKAKSYVILFIAINGLIWYKISSELNEIIQFIQYQMQMDKT